MRTQISEPWDYPRLADDQVESLYETAKKNLKVGFEIELNTPDPDEYSIDQDEAHPIENIRLENVAINGRRLEAGYPGAIHTNAFVVGVGASEEK